MGAVTALLLSACVAPEAEDSGEAPRTRVDPEPPPVWSDTGWRPPADDTASAPPATLPICVNELMSGNEVAVTDETGATPDWFELHNPGDATVDLDGYVLLDDRDRFALHGLTLAPRGFLVLWADGKPELGPTHVDFKLSGEGGVLSVYAPDGSGARLQYGAIAEDFALARTTDCCTGDGCWGYDFHGTPGVSNVPASYADVTLLDAGSTWAYWDRGTSPGDTWADPAFSDAAWARGAAPLGYGDSHVVTTVSYGSDAFTKHLTTWFRATFEGPTTTLDYLSVELLRDDGAVVYLNGAEIVRSNLPEGALSSTTLASASVAAPEETAFTAYSLDPSLVRAGTNTLAVEVHQASVDS
jgi:hypothetical protein